MGSIKLSLLHNFAKFGDRMQKDGPVAGMRVSRCSQRPPRNYVYKERPDRRVAFLACARAYIPGII